ncbi:MAG: ROK family protein [Clostridia bacterium]|nr:ROK family protein [Clostridia bacterium]
MKIGIDLGGSHIAVGLINDDYSIVETEGQNFTAEEKQNLGNVIVPRIKESVTKLLVSKNLLINNIESIGIACPGTVYNGEIIKAGNLGIEHFNLEEAVYKDFNIQVNVENDGKCAAMAEKGIGSLKNYDDCIFMNLGTGIGGAVFLGRKNA